MDWELKVPKGFGVLPDHEVIHHGDQFLNTYGFWSNVKLTIGLTVATAKRHHNQIEAFVREGYSQLDNPSLGETWKGEWVDAE